jgi:hypothetical protein
VIRGPFFAHSRVFFSSRAQIPPLKAYHCGVMLLR